MAVCTVALVVAIAGEATPRCDTRCAGICARGGRYTRALALALVVSRHIDREAQPRSRVADGIAVLMAVVRVCTMRVRVVTSWVRRAGAAAVRHSRHVVDTAPRAGRRRCEAARALLATEPTPPSLHVLPTWALRQQRGQRQGRRRSTVVEDCRCQCRQTALQASWIRGGGWLPEHQLGGPMAHQ